MLEMHTFGITRLMGKGFVKTTHRKASTEYVPHVPACSQLADPPTMRMTVTEQYNGWPFRTLYWVRSDRYYKLPGRTYFWTRTGPSRRITTKQHVWIVIKQPWNAWFLPKKGRKEIYLPVAPIWKGLLLNTFFYALLIRLFMAAPGRIRRMILVKRGLCIKCAYDLRGADHEACPECGTVIVKANPA